MSELHETLVEIVRSQAPKPESGHASRSRGDGVSAGRKLKLTPEQEASLAKWRADRYALGTREQAIARAVKEWTRRKSALGSVEDKARELGVSRSTLENYYLRSIVKCTKESNASSTASSAAVSATPASVVGSATSVRGPTRETIAGPIARSARTASRG